MSFLPLDYPSNKQNTVRICFVNIYTRITLFLASVNTPKGRILYTPPPYVNFILSMDDSITISKNFIQLMLLTITKST